jgi:hypothetical protein
MKPASLIIVICCASVYFSHGDPVKVAQTSSGEFVGAMNPPYDCVLTYFSDFKICFPKSAVFESYADQNNNRAVWMTIDSKDLSLFLKSNGLDVGAANITPRSEHSLPIPNTKHPKEKWEIDFIIQPGDSTAYIRVGVTLKSESTRNVKSEAYLSDAKLWSTNGVIKVN